MCEPGQIPGNAKHWIILILLYFHEQPGTGLFDDLHLYFHEDQDGLVEGVEQVVLEVVQRQVLAHVVALVQTEDCHHDAAHVVETLRINK